MTARAGIRGKLRVSMQLELQAGVRKGTERWKEFATGKTLKALHVKERLFEMKAVLHEAFAFIFSVETLHRVAMTQTDSQTDSQTDRQTDRQTVRQTDRETDRQTDRTTGLAVLLLDNERHAPRHAKHMLATKARPDTLVSLRKANRATNPHNHSRCPTKFYENEKH